MITGIEYPAHIATGRNGEIVIASYMSHKVHVYGNDYQLLRSFGSNGLMDGQFSYPSGVAVDRHNRILVSSMWKIDVFTMNGQFVTAVGNNGNGPLEFTSASGMALSKMGDIFVADTQNNRVQVLSSDLTYRTCFSKACKGVGSGHLNQPQAVAINSEGNIYVADTMNHAVQAFAPDGEYLLMFGKYGTAATPGALCFPMAIAIDWKDNVYVGSSTGTIGIFDKKGNFLRAFGSYDSGTGQFNIIRGMHINRKGHLYVSEWNSNRIQVFPGLPSPTEEHEEKGDLPVDPEGESNQALDSNKSAYLIGPTSPSPIKVITDVKNPSGITEGGNGEVIVTSGEHRMFIYAPQNDYQLVETVGSKGYCNDRFFYPSGVALTPDNFVVVCSQYKLQWFTMAGKLVHAVGCGHSGDNMAKEFDLPADVAINAEGQIYVLYSTKKCTCVKIFNGDATFHRTIELSLPADNEPILRALAINSEGKVYFADSKNNCVHVCSSYGDPLSRFGKTGSILERGTLVSPMAIAIDGEDNVFVASVIISIFDKSGSFIRSFGSFGGGSNQFKLITSLHMGNGFLYVGESSENRIQIFESSTTSQLNGKEDPAFNEDVKTLSFHRPAYTIGPKAEMPVKIIPNVAEPFGIATASNGDLFVACKKGKKIMIFNHTDFDSQRDISRLIGAKPRENDLVDLSDIAFCEDNCFVISLKNQVVKATSLGEVLASVGSQGRRGKGDLELDSPKGITVGKSGHVYVTDKGNDRVQVFNADLSYRSTVCLPGDREAIEKVAVNSEGIVYVTDSRNNCVHVLDQEGKLLFSSPNVSSPEAIAIDHEDYVYLGSHHDEILIYSKDGHFVRAYGKRGDEPGEFRNIKAMHIDQEGNLYVCDKSRIQVFAGIQSKAQVLQRETDAAANTNTTCSGQDGRLDSPPTEVILLNDIPEPYGIAEGKDGELVVSSSVHHQVLVYNSEHKLLAQFGSKGTLDGQFDSPTGVVVTLDRYILVSSRNKLQWFTMVGRLVHATGHTGKEELEFDRPDCITLGRDQRIYVLERGNKRVQILNGNGTFHSSFKFDKDHIPEALAVNSEGSVFLVDTRNSSIQVFSTQGKHLSRFCIRDSKVALPTAIAIDASDNVYIGNACGVVTILDKEGCYLHAFRGSAASAGYFSVIRGLHVGQSHIYVSDFSSSRVHVFSQFEALCPEKPVGTSNAASLPILPHKPVYTVGPPGPLPVRVLNGIKKPSGVATDGNGNIFVASNEQQGKILMFNSVDTDAYSQISEIKNPRDPKKKGIAKPSGLSFTGYGYLLACFDNQLVKMDTNGKALAYFGNPKKKDELNNPGGIALGSGGLIFLVDRGNHRVQILQSDLVSLSSFSTPFDHSRLEQIALNSAGNLYVTDSRNANVQVYSDSGKFLFEFGTQSQKKQYRRGDLCSPHAIAIDKEDYVYVGDENGIVSIFDKEGAFVRSFGGAGDQAGQFGDIQAMHFDHQGNLYVCEWKTNRVQVFQGQGQ